MYTHPAQQQQKSLVVCFKVIWFYQVNVFLAKKMLFVAQFLLKFSWFSFLSRRGWFLFTAMMH
jgi:hypothetical protein